MYHSSQVGRLLENVKQGKTQYYETFLLGLSPESPGGPSTCTPIGPYYMDSPLPGTDLALVLRFR